jgi:hypothetical protein
MPQTNMLIAHILQEMRKDPRPTCLPCLGITSSENWEAVRTQLSTRYREFYLFEEGICSKCKTKQDNILPRRRQ